MGKLVFLANVNFKQHTNTQVGFLNLSMKHVDDTVHCFMFSVKLFNYEYVHTAVKINILSPGNIGNSLV